jgi:hypothetical protein
MAENSMIEPKQDKGVQIYKMALELTAIGGLAFWLTNFAISLTPTAAEYRIALTISYFPMLLEALIAGVIVSFLVSYSLLRFFDRIPTKNTITKSMILSFTALIIVTILIEFPSSLTAKGDALRYFLIGALINILRFLALGIVIGFFLSKFR